MLFNANIILEILRSRFSKQIEDYLEQCIIGFDEYELLNFFAANLNAAVLINVGEMEVEDFSVEEKTEIKMWKAISGFKLQ